MKLILMDIEGTTTSLSFVKDVLFPYSKTNMEAFLLKNHQQENVHKCLSQVEKTLQDEGVSDISLEKLIGTLKSWIDQDKKHPALKEIQGLQWEDGYLSKAYQGHVYDDVFPKLEEWKNKGLKLGIYSSGSVKAQKLLFKYSVAGDLTPLLDYYFDTSVGHKREMTSYQNILDSVQLEANEVLFLSDIEQELDAAKEAGMNTLQLVRPGTLPSNRHNTVDNFSEISV